MDQDTKKYQRERTLSYHKKDLENGEFKEDDKLTKIDNMRIHREWSDQEARLMFESTEAPDTVEPTTIMPTYQFLDETENAMLETRHARRLSDREICVRFKVKLPTVRSRFSKIAAKIRKNSQEDRTTTLSSTGDSL